MRRRLLPYYGIRQSKIDMIVLHTVAYNVEDAINSFYQSEVSSHYIVAENGEVWQLVGEKRRARHAGVSYWRGIEDINSHSIGIEFQCPALGERTFQDFSVEQIQSGKKLCADIMNRYKIKPENVVAHSDIAPDRKFDPGETFPWEEFCNLGLATNPVRRPVLSKTKLK
jgi:N-acetylmuramoyl-L-alanine amidase